MEDPFLHLWLKFQWLSKYYLFCMCHQSIYKVNHLWNSLCDVMYTQLLNDVVRDRVYRDNNTLVMVARQLFSNIWVFKNRYCASDNWLIIFINSYFYQRPYPLDPFGKGIYVFSFTSYPCLASSSTKSIRILVLCFQFMELAWEYFVPFC